MGTRVALLFLVSILSVAGVAYAAAGSAANIGLLLEIAAMAMGVSFGVVAVGYMIGKAVPSSGVLSWINNEWWEIAKSLILIASIMAILTLLGNIAITLAGPGCSPNGDPLSNLNNCAVNYLECVQGSGGSSCTAASTTISDGINSAVDLGGAVGFLQTFSLSYQLYLPPVPVPVIPVVLTWGWSMPIYTNNMLNSNPLKAIGTYESIVNDEITFLLVPLDMINQSQIILLPVLFVLGLYFMIPIGIILRAFPFIRGLGGTLVAVGVGLSVIYPAALVLVNQPIWNTLNAQSPVSQPQYNCGGNLFCDVLTAVAGGASPTGAFGAALLGLGGLFGPLNDLLTFSANMVLYFILFVLDIIIVYPFMDFIAKTLGNPAGIKLSLGGKLKL